MNLICIAIEILLINTLGQYIFNFSQFPDWAEHQAFLAVSKAPRLNVTVNLANALSPKMINVTG